MKRPIPALRTPGAAPGPAAVGFDWPWELLARARERLQWFAWLLVALYVVGLLLHPVFGQKEAIGATYSNVLAIHLAGLALVAALALVARAERLTHTRALELGLVVTVLVCLLLNLEAQLTSVARHGVIRSLAWSSIVIVLYPLMIPSPVHYTLVTALLAALTAPASLLVLELSGVVTPVPMDYLAVSVSPLACAGIAVYGSRVVHEIGREVSEARQMGSYQLESRLAAGGMGEVWRAEHRMLSRPAAIKLVRTDALKGTERDTEITFKRFEREAQATASLRSPHTVDLYDFGRTEDAALYYVMELLEGLDLHRMVTRFGPMLPERVAFLLLQVLHSLKEAHQSGLVHRDIKPANIFVCRYGADLDHVKVLDFGLASLKPTPGEGDARLTKADSMLGTPGYMAPEMMEDGTAVDARTDLYSLGCVAYWMLSGGTVFPEDSMVGSMIAHTFNQPPPLVEVDGVEVPPALEELVMWCLEKNPRNRPQSAVELAERLRGLGLAEAWTPSRAREWWDGHLQAQEDHAV